MGPDEDELALNPRARSAKLRVARRTRLRRAPLILRPLICQCCPPRKDVVDMRPLIAILSFLAILGMGVWAYRENYATQQVLREVDYLNREIAALREALAVQRAEMGLSQSSRPAARTGDHQL